MFFFYVDTEFGRVKNITNAKLHKNFLFKRLKIKFFYVILTEVIFLYLCKQKIDA